MSSSDYKFKDIIIPALPVASDNLKILQNKIFPRGDVNVSVLAEAIGPNH